MKIDFKFIVLALFVFVAATLTLNLSQIAQAEPTAVYELAGSIGAGGTAVAGNYQTDVMIGQTAVGHSANGDYDLGSGFWGGGIITDVTTLIKLFLPLIQH